jgi:hypothetical protein
MTGSPRGVVLVLLLVASATGSGAQQGEYTNNFKYNSGQSIQPVFEGWSRLPDGSYNMHFGYLNRNYVEQPHIPIGPNNRIEPAGPDRGQPTLFYTRTRRNLFTVTVPKDWSRKAELVWTVTHNGKSERAVGWLQTEWEIDPIGGAAGGGNTHPDYRNNKYPSLSVDSVAPVRLPATALLTTTVSDDGLPKPRPRGKRPVGQETPPTLQLNGTVEAPVNVPQIVSRETPPGATSPAGSSRPDGLVVIWTVWRGPAEVTFEPRYAQPKDGKTQTTAAFTVPGEYVLRAGANDGAATTYAEMKVTVSAPSTSNQR